MRKESLVKGKEYTAKTKKGQEVVIFNKEENGMFYFNHAKDTVVQVRANHPELSTAFASDKGTVYSLKNIYKK